MSVFHISECEAVLGLYLPLPMPLPMVKSPCFSLHKSLTLLFSLILEQQSKHTETSG